MILKITLMPKIKETFVGSNVNTKSSFQHPFEFCSNVSFIGTIFSRTWHLLFVLTLLMSNLTFVFLLLSLLVSVHPNIRRSIFVSWVKTNVHTKSATNYQTYMESQLNNVWIWNNNMLMKYHPGDSAEWVIIIWAQFGGQVFGTLRLTALKHFPQTVLSADHNNNLKWTI
jgi:hypothetical protein